MADADSLQFRITAHPEYAPVLRKMDEDGRAAQARFSRAATDATSKVRIQAKQAREAFGRWSAPARALSPELERAHATLEKMGKASKAVQSVFTTSKTRAAQAAKAQAGSLAQMRTEAERGAHRAANIAADKIAGRHGLGRFTGTDDIKAVGQRFFGEERRAADAPTLARAQRDEAHAYESAYKGHMADAERGVADAAKGFEEAGVAAEGAEAGVGALVGTIGGLALAAVAAGVAVEVLAAKASSKFARTGQGIQNASATSGLDATVAQRWRGAAERAGVDPNAAEQAVGGLGLTLHNLSYGMGDAGTANMLRQLGISIPKPGEAPDADAAAKQIIDRLQSIKDPYTRANAARSLGVEALLPMVKEGSAGVSSDQDATQKTGSLYTREDLDKADAQARRLTDFDQSKRGFDKRVGSLATDISAPGLGVASAAVQNADISKVGDLFKGMMSSAGGASGGLHAVQDAAKGAAKMLGDLVAPPAHADTPKGTRQRPGGKALPEARDAQPSATVNVPEAPAPQQTAAPAAPAMAPPTARTPGAQRMSRDVAISERRSASPRPPAAQRPPGPHRPYSMVPAVRDAIEKAAAFYKLDPAMMMAVAARESSFNPGVKAANGWDAKRHKPIINTATGLYQFTEQTWFETLSKHGADAGMGDVAKDIYKGHDGKWEVRGDAAERQRILDMRKDAYKNAMMGGALTVDNDAKFRRDTGRDPTVGQQYGSHMLGIGGEENLARAAPEKNAAALLPEAARHNEPVFYNGGTPLTVEALVAELQRIGLGQPAQVRLDVHMDREGNVKRVEQRKGVVNTR